MRDVKEKKKGKRNENKAVRGIRERKIRKENRRMRYL